MQYYLLIIRNLLIALMAGAAAGMRAARLYEEMPAGWVCEAGEEIQAAHMPAMRKLRTQEARRDHARFLHGRAAGTGCAAAVLSFCLLFDDLSDGSICLPAAAGTLLIVTALAAASQADLTYLIIPDQISLFILTAGFFCSICTACVPELSTDTILSIEKITSDAHASADGSSALKIGFLLIKLRSAAVFSLSGALSGALALFLCDIIAALCSGQQGIGMGDIKLTGACGAFLGTELAFVLILLTSLGTALAALFSRLETFSMQSSSSPSEVQPAAPWILLGFTICQHFHF